MQTGHDGTSETVAAIREIVRRDNRKLRNKLAVAFAALVILFLVFLCTRSTALGFVSPIQVISNVVTTIRLELSELFGGSYYLDYASIVRSHPYYFETHTRLVGGLSYIALGGSLAIAGAVFQCVFRNPLATPSILGTSSGLRIINMILILQYSVTGAYLVELRVIYGYLGSILVLVIMMLLSKLMSKQRSSTADILLIGTVFSRIAMQVVNYVQAYILSDDEYLALEELNLYGSGTGTYDGMIIVLIGIFCGLLPILLTRMSLNVLAFGDEDARSLGVKASVLRGMALICGTILSTSTLVFLGDVSMLAMLIPIVCRYVYGSDTRYLIVASAILGALLMLICKVITSVFAFSDSEFLEYTSIGTLIDLIATPLMIFVVFKNKRGWD